MKGFHVILMVLSLMLAGFCLGLFLLSAFTGNPNFAIICAAMVAGNVWAGVYHHRVLQSLR